MTKRETADAFRQRLGELIRRTELTGAAFARKAGLDRSTLSQLLSEANVRLPRAETIARIAARHNVSIDWLLGLSQHDQIAADIVPELQIEPDAGSPADERLRRWHEEAYGYKVRYVPATLPDQLKTEAVITFETRKLGQAAAEAWTGLANTYIAYARRPETDIEVCSSVQSVQTFARGEGVWRGLANELRRDQLRHMAALARELYPAYRWFLFDERERVSVPYTVFGPKRAAIYVGEMYFVFTSTEHIRALARHFDNLIREARVQANECAAFLDDLAGQVP
ncbi:MAG TPA: helix-turn-helix transcriptional regulator [Geminicoccaceae bacterium]|nr:helix-turn-helix transcriptional regulator [Geminicoccaceae bacterium]